jgi:tripartite-type tricarboxylate transporter receptor subunit TctC
MTIRRIAAVLLVASALIGAGATSVAADEDYPNRPIRVVVPFSAGGTIDVIARSVSEQLTIQMGRPWIVDNRPGANGIVGADIVAKAPPDGYTVMAVTPSFVVNPSVYRKLPFDVLRDFVPVTSLARGLGYVFVVNPSVPVHSIRELIELDQKPGSNLAYSSPGVGNTIHLAGELFNLRAGTHLLHVPYKGIAPAVTAVLGGEVQATVMPPVSALEHIKSGALRALAFTSATRWAEMPELPTIVEAGVPNYVVDGSWVGVFAPAGTPGHIVERLHAEMYKALQVPKAADLIRQGGYEPEGSPPAAFTQFVKAELQRYADAVKAANIKQE